MYDWDIGNTGFDLMVALEEQNPEISEGVWKDKDDDDCGAGDQASTVNTFLEIS